MSHKIIQFISQFTLALRRLPLWRRNPMMNSTLEGYIKWLQNWRKAAYTSTVLLTLTIMAILFPISFKTADNLAEAAAGTAQDSWLTLNSTRSTASVSLSVTNTSGSTATSNNNETALFTIATNNVTGYELKISSTGTTLSNGTDTLTAIGTSGITLSSFSNNTWGYLPNYYDSTANTNNYYYPITTTETRLDKTTSANASNAKQYTIGLGIKANYNISAGTYTTENANNTIILSYVANPVSYSITYNKNTEDTVTNMPYPSSTPANTQSGSVSATSNLVPVREGYDFKGWCLGTVTNTNNEDSCTGTVYNPDGGGTNLTFGIDKTTTNTVTLHAMWKLAKIYMQDMTLSQCQQNVGTNGNAANIGDNITVYDKRTSNYANGDDASYTVRYINGDCWMTQNLRVTGTLSATDSNFTGSNFNVSQYSAVSTDSSYANHCDSTNGYNYACAKDSGSITTGAWYNYVAASAGTITGGTNTTNTTQDICPARWHLPSGPNTTSDTDMNILFGNVTSGWQVATTGLTAFGASADGYYGDGTLKDTGYGLWWTASTYNDAQRYRLHYRASDGQFRGSGNNNRYLAYHIRCVLKQRYSIKINFAGSGVSSVKVCTNAGDCSGSNLKGTISTSGSSVSDLESGSTYYLYPTFSTGYELDSWAKNSSTGTLSSTSAINPTFTLGTSSGEVTLTGKHSCTSTTMQSLTTPTIATLLPNTGDTVCVLDARDNKQYTIGKLADNKYWMLDNLAIDLTATSYDTLYGTGTNAGKMTNATSQALGYLKGTTTGTSSDQWAMAAVKKTWTTSVSYSEPWIAVDSGTSGVCYDFRCVNSDKSWSSTSVTPQTIASFTSIAQGKIGVYYNYCAASAGSYCWGGSGTSSSGSPSSDPNTSSLRDITSDICPYGWRLPTGSDSGEFQALYTAYSSNDTNFQTALSTPLSGYFSSGKAYLQGYNGRFFSSTWYSSEVMYSLNVYSTLLSPSVRPSDTDGRITGSSVRCVFDPPTMQDTTVADLSEGEEKSVIDARDGKDYTIKKINGALWMIQNLRYLGDTGSAAKTMTIGNNNSNVANTSITLYSLNSSNTGNFNAYSGHCDSTNGYNYACVYDSGDTTTGVWYNYYAATAGTISTNSNQDEATSDICPKNWHLPSYNTSSPAGSINSITSQATAFSPVTGGYYINGSLYDTGHGNWWSTTVRTATYRRYLFYNGSSSSLTTGNDDRYKGFRIRCVRTS